MRQRRFAFRCLVLASLLLGACATYQPRPLPVNSGLAPNASALTVKADVLRAHGLDGYPFDPSDGLDPTETVLLAVSNNPDLKAARAKAGVARSQLLAAGLLPDPVLSLSFDAPLGGAAPVPGLGVGLREALDALITRPARLQAAEAEARSIDLSLLWQEWQVAQQVRLLYVRISQEGKKLGLFRQRSALYAEQCELDRRALEQGDVTLDETSGRSAALLEVDTAVGEVVRRVQADEHDLRALLGLAPDAQVVLQGPASVPSPTDDEVREALAELSSHRPDLLALQAGYESQEARLRAAVLGQFPGVEAEVRGARGTDRVRTIGVSIGLRLPFFDRNRGAIAVEEATREQLRLEYQARLARAESDVHKLWTEHQLATTDLQDRKEALPKLQTAAREAERAYGAGDLTGPVRLGTVDAYLRSSYQIEDETRGVLEARVALQTVLGLPRAFNLKVSTRSRNDPRTGIFRTP